MEASDVANRTPPTAELKATPPAAFKLDEVRRSVYWAIGAAICFHLAYLKPALSFLVLGYAMCLVQLARARTGRLAFYLGLGSGLLIAGPQLAFFWRIFGAAAVALWLVVAFWTALFVTLARAAVARFGDRALLLLPVMWTGLEYFRSELYFLRFSWLNLGYALDGTVGLGFLRIAGMYGAGFCVFYIASLCSNSFSRGARLFFLRITALALMVVFALFGAWWVIGPKATLKATHFNVTGIQAEFPATFEVVTDLDKALLQYPNTDLFMLSEYTFDGPIPPQVMAWCKAHGKYVIAGGKEAAPDRNFYNTAFVIGPSGEIVFKQVKSGPIQFFKDGLPAPVQRLWDSPWGKLGVCICYDLSYTRVTDRLVRLGAVGILCPTMDVMDWGRHQHQLHARVAPVRASEYGIPIFRLASSGISQSVARDGSTIANTRFGDQHVFINARMDLLWHSTLLPVDRILAPLCVGITIVIAAMMLLQRKSSPIP